jgi:hypothetical protein
MECVVALGGPTSPLFSLFFSGYLLSKETIHEQPG